MPPATHTPDTQSNDRTATREFLRTPVSKHFNDGSSLQDRLIQRSVGTWDSRDDRIRIKGILDQVEKYNKAYQSGDTTKRDKRD
ncbi:hypothetical protein F4774DRAFT_375198, partial [Daldinia eschscholtzii]